MPNGRNGYKDHFSYYLCALLCLLGACARGPIKSPDQAMRPMRETPAFIDDLEFSSLISGLEANIRHLKNDSGKIPSTFRFGPRTIAKEEYLAALEHLLAEARQDTTGERFRKALREGFEAYEVYGKDDWGEVSITAYFEPLIKGSRRPSKKFSQALYGLPKDMVLVDLASFTAVRPSLQALKDKALEQRSSAHSPLRGRLLPAASPGEPPRVAAYLDRAQIGSGLLKDQASALVWVDPIDAFFLEIQGSGVVQLEDGTRLNVGYAAQNGHPYVPIGKFLLDTIPMEKMSLQAIEAHLRSLPEGEARRIMNQNPSYVFFRQLPNTGLTSLGTEVVAGRTIATDHAYFPKGTLAFLEFDRPVFASPSQTEPTSWKKVSRFVLDQDTGGAIRGPHRVDLFWGRGEDAKQAAGVMKNKGRLVYLVPRAGLFGP